MTTARTWLLVRIPLTVLVIVLVVLIAIFTGLFNIAADRPHSKPVAWMMDELRNLAIAAQAGHAEAPGDLSDSVRIVRGAGMYAEMCESCHLGPGHKPTEISQGLYPPAPTFDKGKSLSTPARQYWVIAHGIKMTGMPAWGRTHRTSLMWDMVAFIQRMPRMTPEEYNTWVRQAPAHDEDEPAVAPVGDDSSRAAHEQR